MDSMEIDDNIYIKKNLTMEGLVTKVDFQRRKQPSRCVSVCLGLLCAVLLAGNIGQFIYYEIIGRLASADPTQASLQFQVDQLQAKMSNLTEEKGQLQQSYTALTTERDEFRASFNNLTNERDQLQDSYYTLKRESDQLQTSYNNMQKSLEELQANHDNLTATKDQLQTNNTNLQRQKDELQTLSISLRANRDQLQSNYSSMKINKDQLQINYNTMSPSKDDLQIRYDSLTRDKDRLLFSYNSLQNEKEELQNKYNSSVQVKDELEKVLITFRGKPCESGWSKFEKNCYFLSTEEKNWTSSRADCIARGADLVVIDSRDEQAFVNKLLPKKIYKKSKAWIGMTDSVREERWMWVDGTPVTTTYWESGQPNSYKGNQDCGEITHKPYGVGEWNDEGCSHIQTFICEQ